MRARRAAPGGSALSWGETKPLAAQPLASDTRTSRLYSHRFSPSTCGPPGLIREHADFLVDRYSERVEVAAKGRLQTQEEKEAAKVVEAARSA